MAAIDELIQLAAIEALEEVEEEALYPERRFQENDNPSILYSERQFSKQYRFRKTISRRLIGILSPFLVEPSRASAISAERKVLTALRFFASGSYQMDIGLNVNSALRQSSVSRCITEVSYAMNRPEIFQQYVSFPRTINEIEMISREFYALHHFPGVIGCIDCTHVAIFPPKRDDVIYPEAAYVNRKGYHSINVQLISAASMKIINVNSRFPGSTNDSFIWSNSNVLPILQDLHDAGRHYFLLGDSGYPLRPWLLTPLAEAEPGTAEEAYNNRQIRTRSIIERCNGILKMRFRCLLKHRVLHNSPRRASTIINSCIILHYMCIEESLPIDMDPEDEDLDFGMGEMDQGNGNLNNGKQPELMAGRRMPQLIIRNHFT